MPYRVKGKNVQVKHSGKWKTIKGGKHKSHKEALAHLAAILINLRKSGGGHGT